MTYNIAVTEQRLQATKEWLQQEYQNIRTGRAAPAFLDGVHVQAYGSSMPLKQVANVGIEDARTLAVNPFDASLTQDIERAITAEDLGVGVSVSGTTIRVSFPELTSERRQELVKAAKGKLEESRVSVRGIRNEANDAIDAAEKGGEMNEDDKFRAKEELQKKVDATNTALDDIFHKKESELMQ